MINRIANKDVLISKVEMLKRRNFKPGSDGMSSEPKIRKRPTGPKLY